ncbi:ATP-binding cassette domain-containing protein [bacterium]|nr:ATP-binding cassette domain-containing protein [candidate division CSSED10-310 bacterium]
MIEVKELTKRFGTTVAVRNVSFSVPAGQVLGFLGPNGAGKTTTMRILTGFIPADSGSASVGGFDIYTQSLDVRKKIGYLPENAPLYHDMDLPDFLQFIATVRKIPKNKRQKAIDKMVQTCGLESVLFKKIGELSKGFRQRVGLAQAMIHDPDILVLDEPTSGLDPNQIVEIRELIRQLGKEKTVILSTHILQEVTATCDRILIINDGKLVADGTPDNLAAQAAGDAILWCTLKAPADQLKTEISRMTFVKTIHYWKENGDRVRLGLRCAPGEDINERLFHLAVDKEWILLELHWETASLEDVFARLTT